MPNFIIPNSDCLPNPDSGISEAWSDAARKAAAAGRSSRKSGNGIKKQKIAALRAFVKAGGKRGQPVNPKHARFPGQRRNTHKPGDRPSAGLRSRIRRFGLKPYRSGTSVDHFKDNSGKVHTYDLKTKKWSMSGKSVRTNFKRSSQAQKRAKQDAWNARYD